MTNETQATTKGPSRKQAVILALSGIVLGLGGCATFMNELDNALSPGGGSGNAALEIIGAGTFVTGVILTILGAIRMSRAMRGEEQRDDQ